MITTAEVVSVDTDRRSASLDVDWSLMTDMDFTNEPITLDLNELAESEGYISVCGELGVSITPSGRAG